VVEPGAHGVDRVSVRKGRLSHFETDFCLDLHHGRFPGKSNLIRGPAMIFKAKYFFAIVALSTSIAHAGVKCGNEESGSQRTHERYQVLKELYDGQGSGFERKKRNHVNEYQQDLNKQVDKVYSYDLGPISGPQDAPVLWVKVFVFGSTYCRPTGENNKIFCQTCTDSDGKYFPPNVTSPPAPNSPANT
jgi:hypothetical protein